PDWIGTRIKVQDARVVANLLQQDVLLLSQEGDADGALRSVRALLNNARSVGDEPLHVSQRVRMACRAVALGSLERVLAQGEPSPQALAELQQLLEMEEQENLLLYALRGERAGLNQLLEALQTRQVRPNLLTGAGLTPSKSEGIAAAVSLYSPGALKNQWAALVRSLTRAAEAAKLPAEQQPAEFTRIETDLRDQGIFVRLLMPALARLMEANRSLLAQTRCAIAALAAERYRGAHGDWPASLEALVADGLLKWVPADPYDGAPLR